jgi:hypothetical protein
MSERCSHGRTFSDPCSDCDRVWQDMCIRDLHRSAARLGYRVVSASESLSEWQIVNNVLADACAAAGSQQTWARENGVSPQFVCDVLQGRRAPTDRLGRALGYRRVVSFEKVNG